jgi:hypothetical protein
LKAFFACSLNGPLARFRVLQIAAAQMVQQAMEAVNCPMASKFDELYFLFFPRLKADGGSGRDMEAQTVSCGTVERESGICFEEVVMTPNLYRSVAGVSDENALRFSSGVRDHWTLGFIEQILTRFHRASDSTNRIVDGD